MERENYLKEQIDSYIDQLDLLGMQETIDAERIDKVVARVKELATEYISLLDGRVESQIQGIEKRFAVTLEEELEKRNQIYTVVNQKLQEILAMFSDVKKNELELDKVAEQTFLHLLGKMMQSPVDSYESLEKRTKIVQGIVSSRISKVEQLYQEGVIENGEYETLASRIDHSRIYRQLSDLAELEKNEELIISIEEQLQHTRDEVKGKEDLELIFAERAKERGRIAIVPEAPEILFEDEQVNRDRKRRRQIISIEPAKKSLLEKLGKAKDSLLSTLRTIGNIPGKIKEQIEKMIEVPVKYKPTIGDQIELREKAVIYSNPMDIVEEKGRKEAKEVSLIGTKLFVTRGAILDHTGTPIYITTEYGVDLETVAKNMNLSEGTYNIVLGCSIGDADGKFIAVTDDKLNADIEKGWINAADANIMVLCQLNEEQKKGGIKK